MVINNKESENFLGQTFNVVNDTTDIIRSRDWKLTALGETAYWPVSLRTSINMLLASPFPQYLAWGQQHFQFYNKQFQSLVFKNSQPALQGDCTQPTFPETWPLLKPAFDAVMQGKSETVSNISFASITGNTADCFFTCSCNPIYQENHEVGGVLVSITDTKQKKDAALQLKEFSEFDDTFRSLALQSPIATAILRGYDLIIEMANEAILRDIWQKGLEEVTNKKLLDIFPGLQQQHLPALLEEVFSSGKTYRQNEAVEIIETKNGVKKYYFDIVYAPLHDTEGSVDGIIMTINNVTEKVETRQLIEDAEQRSRLAIEAASMGTFDWDLVEQHFVPSKRLVEIFGFSDADNVTHHMLINAFHPADKPIRNAAFNASLTKGSLEYEARVIKPDKSICWVKVYGKIVYSKLNKPMRMLGTVTDITQEKTTLLALEESGNRLNIALSTASLGTYDVDILSSLVICSPRFNEIFDIPAGIPVKRDDILNILYPEDIHTRNLAHETGLSTGDIAYESRIVWRDKSIHWVRVNARILKDENQKPYRILGTVMDITEQKFYIHQLEESEQRFKIIADSAPVMLWMSNTDMLSTFFNKSWLKYTGRRLEQELGNGWLESVHPDDLAGCTEVFTKAFFAQKEFYMEYRVRRHDGVYRWMSDYAIPRIDTNGVFLGHIGACMDIDEQKKLNEELTKSEARLRIAALSGELGTWDYDPATNELYWDDACAEIFGAAYHVASSVDLFWQIVYPADDAVTTQKVRDSLDPATASNFDAEFRVIDPSTQKIKWINAKGKAFFKDGAAYRFAGTVLDITEKKLALEALQERELLFKTITNAPPVGLWLTDDKGVNTFVNNTWINWTGIPFEEQLNDGWFRVVVEEDKQRIFDLFRESFSKQEKFSTEFRLHNSKNELCWCLTEGFPYYNVEGSFAGYAGSVTDITEQVKNIDALKKSEERFRLLANAMPQFIWTSDRYGNLNYFNQSVYDSTNLDPILLEARDGWLNIVHPKDREENINRWMHSISTGEDFFFEHRFMGKNGKYRWQLSRALPQRDTNGEIQMWIGTSTDIHDQKLMAEELENKVRQRTAELQHVNDEIIQQKEFVEIVLDSSLIMVTVFDTQKNVLSFNKKCEEIFHLNKEDVIGRAFNDVFPGIELSQTWTNIDRAIDGESFHVSSYRSVINNHYYESYFTPLKDKNNEVYAVLMTAHDITEIIQSTEKVKHAYNILEEQNRALERSNQELESFSYVASHDLQEPLRKIQTFIELLHRNLGNAEISEKYFHKITSSAQRMAALIRDVLNYSKLARQGESLKPVDLNQLIEDVKTDFELLIAEKHAIIQHGQLPLINGISLQLQQLFTNLVSNSLKFSDTTPIIKIECIKIAASEANIILGLEQTRSYFHLIFSDNGIGFEQQFSEKIFDIFQRLNNRNYSGTGIGLALCKKIVENHNGYISALSEPGKGATFHIYLPAD
ncbi:hypothetical protein BH10BAC3_BH10BAC3_07430 [soil metagenome]